MGSFESLRDDKRIIIDIKADIIIQFSWLCRIGVYQMLRGIEVIYQGLAKRRMVMVDDSDIQNDIFVEGVGGSGIHA